MLFFKKNFRNRIQLLRNKSGQTINSPWCMQEHQILLTLNPINIGRQKIILYQVFVVTTKKKNITILDIKTLFSTYQIQCIEQSPVTSCLGVNQELCPNVNRNTTCGKCRSWRVSCVDLDAESERPRGV